MPFNRLWARLRYKCVSVSWLREVHCISIHYRVFSIQYSVSSIQHSASSIQYSAFSIFATSEMTTTIKASTIPRLIEDIYSEWLVNIRAYLRTKKLWKYTQPIAMTLRSKGEKCQHCEKDGHQKKACWKLHPELIPDWVKEKREEERSSFPTEGIQITC